MTQPKPLASTLDLEAIWQRALSDTQKVHATVLLSIASAIVRNRVAKVDERVVDGTLDPGLVSGVVAGMVLRVMQNPERWQSRSVGSISVSFDTPTGAGAAGVVLTDEEAALLGPPKRAPFGTTNLQRTL